MNLKDFLKRIQEMLTTTKSQGCTINGHEWVDLGLSVKWATCNVGASSPSDWGCRFAWGETEPKSEYSWKNYKFWVSGEYAKAIFNKYTTKSGRTQDGLIQTSQFSWENLHSVENEQSVFDNKMKLDMSDDAAHVNWADPGGCQQERNWMN